MEGLLGLRGVLVEVVGAVPELNGASAHLICRILCLSLSVVVDLAEMEDQRETDPQGQQGATPLLEALSWEGEGEVVRAVLPLPSTLVEVVVGRRALGLLAPERLL